MNRKVLKLIIVSLVLALSISVGSTGVEWEILNTLKLDAPPMDVAVSPDGKSVFVLTNDGNIYIYALDGSLKDKIEVGKQIDQIKLGPKGEHLFATNRQNKTVKVIALDFIQPISIQGSPFKGPEDAPIAIAEFSDFE